MDAKLHEDRAAPPQVPPTEVVPRAKRRRFTKAYNTLRQHLPTFVVALALVPVACQPRAEPPSVESLSSDGYAVDVVGQAVQERVWQNVELQQLHRLPLDGEKDAVLYIPSLLTLDDRQYVYVMDYGDWTVKAFSPDGQYVRSYGNGSGEGPGEFISVVDGLVLRDSVLVVVDASGRRISSFSLDGSFVGDERTWRGFYRYREMATGGYYAQILSSDFMFEAKSDSEVVRFGTLLENQLRQDAIRVSGHLDTYRGDMIFVSNFSPILLRYAPDGSLVYARATPDYDDMEELPSVTSRTTQGGVAVIPPSGRKYSEVTVIDDMVYVHVLDDPPAFDMYDARTGDYQSSISLPSTGLFYISPNRVYQVKDTTVVVYAMYDS